VLRIKYITRRYVNECLVNVEVPVLPEHLISPLYFSGVRPAQTLLFCVVVYRSLFVLFVLFHLAIVLVDRCLFFVPFHLAIVLSVLLRYTASDYSFGIFKLFLPYLLLSKCAELPI